MKKRQLFVLVLVVGLALILTWVVAAKGPELEQSGTRAEAASGPLTLKLNLSQKPSTLDPALSINTASDTAIEQLFIGLPDLDDETAEVQPDLAASWFTLIPLR